MAILNGYISTNEIILITDTLNCKRGGSGEIIPVNFQSKVFILPHLNVCFCVQTGNADLGLSLFNYLQKHIIGDEIHTIIQQIESALVYGDLPSELFLPQNNGRILLFGMYYTFNVLESYALSFVNNTMTIEQVYKSANDATFIFTQPEMDISYYSWTNFEDILSAFVDIVRDQKNIEDVLPSGNKAGLGGSIQVTHLSLIERQVSYQIYKLLDFNDKTDMHVSVWKNWKK